MRVLSSKGRTSACVIMVRAIGSFLNFYLGFCVWLRVSLY